MRGYTPADGVSMGHVRKRGKRALGECKGRQERRRERHLCDVRRGGEAGPPWVVEGAREKKRRPRGMGGGRTLGSGEKLWGPRGFQSGPQALQSGRGGGGPGGLRSGGKPREGPPRSGEGGRIVSERLDLPQRRRGVELYQDDSTPNGGGGGVESWQDDSNPQANGGGVESSWKDSTPREDGGPEGVETLGDPTASRSQQGEDGRGRERGDENSPTTQPTRERPPDGGDGAA